MADSITRLATPTDAVEVARLLHDFNAEFDAPSPGVDAIAHRLTALLADPSTAAILAGRPSVGVAIITLRPNVWCQGPVALLDELYVAPAERGKGIGSTIIDHLFAFAAERGVELIEVNVDAPDVDAQRFYERHGFSGVDPDTGERAFYYCIEPNR